MSSLRIGVDLGGTKIEAVVLDAAGRELWRHRVPTPRNDYAGTVQAIAALVAQAEAACGTAQSGQQRRVGVGIPGTVSPATGLIKNANSTWLNGQPLHTDLAATLGRPVRVANDANCFAASEAADGGGAGAEVVFGVILGTGVGGGIVVRGGVLTGPNAVAGEWGHTPLPWPTDDERPGPACYCGLHGCIESFLSGPALARDYAAQGGQPGTAAAELARLAEAGDAPARAALQRHAARLARALGVIITILDPDVIVLGGGLSNLRHLYTDVPAQWTQWVFSDRVDTVLKPNVHGDSSGVRGAAWLWPAEG